MWNMGGPGGVAHSSFNDTFTLLFFFIHINASFSIQHHCTHGGWFIFFSLLENWELIYSSFCIEMQCICADCSIRMLTQEGMLGYHSFSFYCVVFMVCKCCSYVQTIFIYLFIIFRHNPGPITPHTPINFMENVCWFKK